MKAFLTAAFFSAHHINESSDTSISPFESDNPSYHRNR